jgi:hypothetical protein
MVYSADQLNAQLPGDLEATIEEGISVSEYSDGPARTVYPDVHVREQAQGIFASGSEPGELVAVVAAEPYIVAIDDDERTGRHVEIIDTTDGGRVVTVIEFLSPANKISADGQSQYFREQREYLAAGVNLVEIDLIRAGNYVLSLSEDRLPANCRGPYLACVRRAARLKEAEIYPLGFQSLLPGISIPLRPVDRAVVLKLQNLIDSCYRVGRFHRIDYRRDPIPHLSESDAKWIDGLLREKGLRG